MSVRGVARDLTTDHKPYLPTEKTRIETAGGWVHNKRVNGVLAVSRSFGDIQYKAFDDVTPTIPRDEAGGIWSNKQQVISRPDVTEFEVDDDVEFVVLASDGLWDVFSSQEVVNFIRHQLHALHQEKEKEKGKERFNDFPDTEGVQDLNASIASGTDDSPQTPSSKVRTPIPSPARSTHTAFTTTNSVAANASPLNANVNMHGRAYKSGTEGDLERAATRLLQQAQKRGTADNTSVIVCAFNQVKSRKLF
jgi:serine/threonine protein phosphatase PrpC